ncbi:hypothetical protein M1397_03110 [Candidatus Marsarchaeota archaeon]|jgi:hypothetical protein|nr:hypothetical protein [Candidatus Marsarchaeota archaeon]
MLATKQKSQEIYEKALFIIQKRGVAAINSSNVLILTFDTCEGLSIDYTASDGRAGKRNQLFVRSNGAIFIRVVGENGKIFEKSEGWGGSDDVALAKVYAETKIAVDPHRNRLRLR